MPGTRDDAHDEDAGRESPDPVSDVVRWAAFSCTLVPVVLLMCGQSLGGAAGSAAGLVAVTCACRALLRRSERAAGRAVRGGRLVDGPAERAVPHRGRHGRTGSGTHRGSRHAGTGTPLD
ncbi:hypothetical protein [Streptomyces caatingaensis]|uniref:Uncharacterized protein n=1 Tax=Streptomyces caatingaensis TaxID=1678637 RepID=A0A0K9X7K2_9ACTN|nr:hypothetical protein [Streptomyces caatingaensis]KNB49424.1 hypothetical protein AC230_29700 [Streptomyces caatingaensis]